VHLCTASRRRRNGLSAVTSPPPTEIADHHTALNPPTRSLKEIRALVVDMEIDESTKTRKLSFLEWACAIFGKSWEELHAEVHLLSAP
jgi:hypothetical protein